jgi:hypothetical protein
MDGKAPALLLVLVETARLRWFVAALDLDGRTTPLLCSEEGDLDRYVELHFDEQVSFLRHRFCGVLQRGCDRLWARGLKACQFIFLFDQPMPDETGELTPVVADHFVEWMLNPPVIVYTGTDPPEQLAGRIESPLEALLQAHLGEVLAARDDPSAWELAPRKKA